MKIVILTDVHGNLPALEAVVEEVEREGYDRLYHLGDAVAIGPYPAECLELLLTLENAQFLMGNHDEWLVHGLPQPQPEWMSDGEVVHQKWTHAQVTPSLKEAVADWPYVIHKTVAGVKITLLHYALDTSGVGFGPILRDPHAAQLDALFNTHDGDVIFYGHTHQAVDLNGRMHYVNPGALGCHSEAVARYLVVECKDGGYEVEKRAVTYDVDRLYAAFEERQVPERQFLYKAFFGGLMPC